MELTRRRTQRHDDIAAIRRIIDRYRTASRLFLGGVPMIVDDIIAFIETTWIPDVQAVAASYDDYYSIGQGPGNLLAFGAFEGDADGSRLFPAGVVRNGAWEALDIAHITEEVGHSRFSSASAALPTSTG